jgi:glycolate oxidase FAD binding subunit
VTIVADTIDDVRDAVRCSRVLAVGAGTKTALATTQAGIEALDVSRLSGVIEYDPRELTLTARAGTRVDELAELMARHDQHLPFDPPFASRGATLGGTVAAGASGSGAFAHGSVRDFVLGVRVVDGTGTVVRGGGKVVKNAAGYDLPKLMVGSMGRLGVIVEISLKVFPRPPASIVRSFAFDGLGTALAALSRLAGGKIALDALDLEPPARLWLRIAGAADTLEPRLARLEALAGVAAQASDAPPATELAWVPPGHGTVRIALTSRHVTAVERLRGDLPARYVNAANVAWIAWPEDQSLERLDAGLAEAGLSGMAITGRPGRRLLGVRGGGVFGERVRAALDPDGRFPRD